ncbi:uncharacterized protein METZ01_LOCUS486691 [marine metagenome]|uniref:Uncharacterized protein n=1 Tax=marine metagenome TaxID=408172 RepID=A0A383CN95_9ZZZZ
MGQLRQKEPRGSDSPWGKYILVPKRQQVMNNLMVYYQGVHQRLRRLYG